ncbi:nucleoside/nucleotide kinase family protein [Agrobacterium sp. rho-13.3]|uniref:nucleoside/nucleotide kinase family protein n=1 Tax=Agrobacterium sp. rho-13.3 TaxID=3072980 RepID=UPI002A12B13C|nr:nucleoside/nucleotide kinase family protein [Agrobacterium sp. rho-13.3]MDX8309218.1 nucleoside/nucleotide kinase family protein [Agrobacterium sp. rho-13.3]
MTKIEDIASDLVFRASMKKRYMIAVAGPPGAGKSTFAQALRGAFPKGDAAVFQMDGFHYDNSLLDALDLRSRKGAPETFDFAGFETMLRRLQSGNGAVTVPIFDRSLDLARAGAVTIPETTKFIIVEGNYLLLDEEPWSGIFDIFDFRIFLDVKSEELERRLMERWVDLDIAIDTARQKVTDNDMPNVDRVIARSAKADLVVGN